ncbi:MAG: type II toxin-antitoxin system VapC family toxin [Hyphomicrobiales bacterium]
MIAVDTNILVYAHRRDAPWHSVAASSVAGLAEGNAAWSIPWPCVHEFIAVVTSKRIYLPSSTIAEAIGQLDAWMGSPQLQLLSESTGYWAELRELAEKRRIAGPQIHDTRVAALCLYHGVSELWTADRDFSRFPDLKTRNPLVA